MPLFILFLYQLKRLKLRKNNWESDTYEFDEVLTEYASQKRVYEVVAKPVVEVRCLFIIFIFINYLFLILQSPLTSFSFPFPYSLMRETRDFF